MASSAYPYGMIPVLNQGAQYNSQGYTQVPILDGYTTSIFFGDVVKIASDGTIQKDTGTSTLTPYGVFLGCTYIDVATGFWLNSQYWPASTTTSAPVGSVGYPMAQVMTFPWGVFQIQADGPVTLGDVGANAAIIQTAGSTSIGKSKNALNASSINTTDTLPLRIVGLVNSPNNASGDAYTDCLVVFNNNQQLFTKLGN